MTQSDWSRFTAAKLNYSQPSRTFCFGPTEFTVQLDTAKRASISTFPDCWVEIPEARGAPSSSLSGATDAGPFVIDAVKAGHYRISSSARSWEWREGSWSLPKFVRSDGKIVVGYSRFHLRLNPIADREEAIIAALSYCAVASAPQSLDPAALMPAKPVGVLRGTGLALGGALELGDLVFKIVFVVGAVVAAGAFLIKVL